MSEKKITLDGALMRNRLRGKLAKEIAKLPLSTEGVLHGVTLDDFILRAREIEKTAAKGESL